MGLISKPLTRAMGLVVDTSQKVTRAQAKAIYAAGVRAIGRYVFFGQPKPEDLDAQELLDLTGEGHVVWVIQHPREPSDNTLSADTGKADADWAVTNSVAAGYDPSVIQGPLSLTLDMEGLKNPGPSSFAHACECSCASAVPMRNSSIKCASPKRASRLRTPRSKRSPSPKR